MGRPSYHHRRRDAMVDVCRMASIKTMTVFPFSTKKIKPTASHRASEGRLQLGRTASDVKFYNTLKCNSCAEHKITAGEQGFSSPVVAPGKGTHRGIVSDLRASHKTFASSFVASSFGDRVHHTVQSHLANTVTTVGNRERSQQRKEFY